MVIPKVVSVIFRTGLAGALLALGARASCPPLPGGTPALLAAEPKPAAKDKKPNRLARETSPYLLMHAHNPVDWYAWGPEAFEKAKKEKKLVFLSIGYSSCYWCHVMERQSFANAEVAKLMNDRFVCIKVDREERPDVDSIYMTALHVQGSRGGWPLSMFLTPDGKPIGGGTYWPPDDREIDGETVRGFKTILKLVHEDWEKNREALEKHADRLADGVKGALANASREMPLVELNRELVDEAVASAKADYDSLHGGFGSHMQGFRGPKFPQPPVPELLLAEYTRTKDEATLKMVTQTLDRMAMGGIYDHVGGGFHRYSVDRQWKVPHFEKMLYDNAQLVSLYSKAYQLTKKPAYRRVIEETLAFIDREMTSPDGGFYSALDAETDAEEGKFYVWTAKEIDAVLPKAEAEMLNKVYGVDAGPNFEEKYSVLLLPKSMADVAAGMKTTEEQLVAQLKPIRQKLFDIRAKRARPFLDTKVLTGWNGLMIAGYADAAAALEEPRYARTAERAASFVLSHLRTKEGRLLRTWSAASGGEPPLKSTPSERGERGGVGQARLNGYLEDYAYLVHGLLSLHEATGNKKWLDEAVSLTNTLIEFHGDKEAGGFFFTSHDHEKLFARAKDQYDGALPSGNSVAALSLLRLAAKTGEARYRQQAEKTFRAFTGTLKSNPGGLPALARALSLWLDGKKAPDGKGDDAPGKPKVTAPQKDDPVKVSAALSPEKPGADGKQTLTLTLEIEKGWHIYANPAGDESTVPTTVQLSAKAKLEDVKVEYPAGKEMKDPAVEKPVRVYEGKTAIKVTFRRGMVDGKVDASPVEATVRYQACDDRRCLPPKTVKLKIGEGE